jgi:hypothetical protein
VIKCKPLPTELGVYVTEQVAIPPLPEIVHVLGVKLPDPSVVQEIVPVGLIVPLEAVTVATQVILEPYPTIGVPAPQFTLVVVPIVVTV